MIILPLLYLPPLSYMAIVAETNVIRIEACENYVKSTFRNRCIISGSNGPICLSVPIRGGRDQRIHYRDSQIAYTENWQHIHWSSIMSCYGSAPYFEHYEHYLRPFYHQQFDNLFEFNLELFQLINRLMKLKPEISLTEEYIHIEKELDKRLQFKPGSVKAKENIKSPNYIRVFDANISEQLELSCLDLLFNEGPNSRSILEQMIA